MRLYGLACVSLVVSFLVACAGPSSGRAAPPPSVVPPPDAAAIDAICSTRFAGLFASVLVYREATAVRALELRPDLTRASHPPTTIYDATGTLVLTIPEYPVVPGSDEARGWTEKRQAAIGAAQPAETIRCALATEPIHALRDVHQGRHVVEGFVATVYACPPCPPNADCKPCIGDFVVLAEDDLAGGAPDPRSERVMRVFVENPRAFESGRRYRVMLRVRGPTDPGRRIDDAVLIGAQRLR